MDLLKRMNGIRYIVFWSLVLMIVVLAIFNTANMAVDNMVILIFTSSVFVFAVVAFAFAFVAISYAALALLFAFAVTPQLAFPGFVIAAFIISKKCKVKRWKCVLIFVTEEVLLLASMGLAGANKYIVALSVTVIVFLLVLAESKFYLWLVDNQPSPILSGNIRGSLCARIHRLLHRMY